MRKLATLVIVILLALAACAPRSEAAIPAWSEEDFSRLTNGRARVLDDEGWMLGFLPSAQLTVDGQPAVLVVVAYQAIEEGLEPHPARVFQPGYQPKLITTYGKLVDPWYIQAIDCWPANAWPETFLYVTECRDPVPGVRGVLLLFFTDQQSAGLHYWLESLTLHFSSVP